MSRAWGTLIGACELARLLVMCRFRLHGAYLSWRRNTAVGDMHVPQRELLHHLLIFGRWAHAMRRRA